MGLCCGMELERTVSTYAMFVNFSRQQHTNISSSELLEYHSMEIPADVPEKLLRNLPLFGRSPVQILCGGPQRVWIFSGWGGEPKFGGGENPPSAQCHFISIGKPIKKSLRARMERFPPPLNLRPPPNQTNPRV